MEIFNYLVEFMRTLLTYCYDLTKALGFPSYGIAIIILTIAIKAVLAPLTAKQVKSMKGMQKLQPKMKEIQQKYKNDPQKAQQEIAKMYKEMGVNPLSGCLPLLVQMPFLISIFCSPIRFDGVSITRNTFKNEKPRIARGDNRNRETG